MMEKDEDTESEKDVELVHPEEEHYGMLIRRNFHATPRIAKSAQTENIFQTKCKIGNKICAVIIDRGSESNCVSRGLVKDLTLTTTRHPHPYKPRWLNDQT